MTRLGAAAWMVAALSTVPSIAAAADSAPDSASTPATSDPTPATAETGGSSIGPILWSCLGVVFGGALAVWQIRGMKKNG